MEKIILLGHDSDLGRAVLSLLEVHQRRGRDLRITTSSLKNVGSRELRRLSQIAQGEAWTSAIVVADDFHEPNSHADQTSKFDESLIPICTLLEADILQIIWVFRDPEPPTLFTGATKDALAETRNAIKQQNARRMASHASTIELLQAFGRNTDADIRFLEAPLPFFRSPRGYLGWALRQFRDAREGQRPGVRFGTSNASPLDVLSADDLARATVFTLDLELELYARHFGDARRTKISGQTMVAQELLNTVARKVGYQGQIILDQGPALTTSITHPAPRLQMAGWSPHAQLTSELDIVAEHVDRVPPNDGRDV